MQQISMRAMELDGVDTDIRGALGGSPEVIAQSGEVAIGEHLRRMLVGAKGKRGGGNGLPSAFVLYRYLLTAKPWFFGRCFPTGMGQLHGNRHVGPVPNVVENVGHCSLRSGIPETDVGVAYATFRRYRRRLDRQRRST